MRKLILLLVIAISTSGCGFVNGKPDTQTLHKPSQPTANVNLDRSYSNSLLGYTFQYPDSLDLTSFSQFGSEVPAGPRSSSLALLDPADESAPALLQVEVFTEINLLSEQSLSTELNREATLGMIDSVISILPTTLSGDPALEVHYAGQKPESQYTDFFVQPPGNPILTVSTVQPDALSRAILNSFTLLK